MWAYLGCFAMDSYCYVYQTLCWLPALRRLLFLLDQSNSFRRHWLVLDVPHRVVHRKDLSPFIYTPLQVLLLQQRLHRLLPGGT